MLFFRVYGDGLENSRIEILPANVKRWKEPIDFRQYEEEIIVFKSYFVYAKNIDFLEMIYLI